MAIRRYFEWIDGEDIGEVEVLECIEIMDGETFYHFESGETCNLRFISKMTNNRADLKGKFMVEISSPGNPWTMEVIQPKKYIDESMKGEDIDIPTLHDILQGHGSTTNVTDSDVGKQRLVAPKMPQSNLPLPKPEEYPMKVRPVATKPVTHQRDDKTVVESLSISEDAENETNKQVQNTQNHQQPVQKQYNPVHILVDSCKKKETEISLDMNIMLPSKYIYNIAANEFENGVEDFIDYVVGNIDTNLIIQELKLALIQAYQQVDPPINKESD
jgi:hypothetical protein